MNQQTIQFLKNEELRRVRCFDKFEYLGDIFSRTKRSMAGLFSFWNLQNALRVDSGIRAGLYTPDWKRPI
ncbi:MAG: hypothetical protein U1C57_02965 [Candidatus Doudnabacteria bacterium]|nr:hypothetical protein [Candidatus Doudnabacteria bacterium]